MVDFLVGRENMTPLMTLGFFTDLHARNDTPTSRTDDFRNSILTKLHESGEIFKKANVDCVLFGGDLGHTPDPSYSLANAIVRELRRWELPIIGVVGSHDYFGYQKMTIERTIIGTMVAAGIMQLVDENDIETIFSKDSNTRVIITGSRHQYDSVDYPERLNHKYIDDGALLQIQLVHCDLFHEYVPWRHLLIENIKTESDLVLSGHIHSGWKDPIKINDTTFFNPGSIGRLEKSKIQRIPRVLIINIYGRKEFSIESVYLSSALINPFKDSEEKDLEEYTSQDISKLINFIESADVEITDVKQLLLEFSKKEKYSKKSVEIAFELLETAKTLKGE
ncbi:MAG: metallophosphoesterase family protein [Novosphingobium sp.]|nr:metallophosphoesterase family protein [Novosphingobium sp.]